MIIVAGLVLMVVAVAVLARVLMTATPGRRAVDRQPAPAKVTATTDVEDDVPTPLSLQPWLLRGIGVDEAMEWIDRGFDADHAFLLISMGVDAETASKLREAGLDDGELVTLVEEASFRQQRGQDQLVALAERAPHLAPQAVGWISAGLSADRALAYAAAGLTAAMADEWTSTGWDLDEALPWFSARFEPAAARAWRANGFEADEAHSWKSEHFGVKQAADWRRLGDTPADARDVEQRLAAARITVADGLNWLDRGFSVDEICAGWPSMTGADGDSWRNDWKGLTLTPGEVKEWHTRFGRDEAAEWIEAGVRDPALAVRLRRRGLGPTDVHRVADRFADVFDAVPVTRDDLLSAAGQLGRAGGSPAVRAQLQDVAASGGAGRPMEVSGDLIEAVLDELQSLDAAGALGAPHAARALARRLEQGLIVSALITGRREHLNTERAVS